MLEGSLIYSKSKCNVGDETHVCFYNAILLRVPSRNDVEV